MKSVESTPAPSVSPDEHGQPAASIPSNESVTPLTTDIETFTSLRDKLIQRMRDEIKAAEEKLAELNQQFATLFPELTSEDQPAQKPKKPKPKPSTKSESSSSEDTSTTAEE